MNGRPWTPAEDRALRLMYPDMRTVDVGLILGRKGAHVYARADRLGLKKSEAFNNSPLSGRMHKGWAPYGVQHRFPKGHVPANKGLRRPGYAPGRMAETQFKKGHPSPTKCEIGDLRINSDGYIDMKVSEDKGAKAWKPLHRLLWEDVHGPIPKGHMLKFIDGDKLNVCVENLQLLSFADNMRLNTIHKRYSPEVRSAIQLLGQLKRKIREKQDRRSA